MNPNEMDNGLNLTASLREKLVACLESITGDKAPTPETVIQFWGSPAIRSTLISQFRLSNVQTEDLDKLYAEYLKENPEILRAKQEADRVRARFRNGLLDEEED